VGLATRYPELCTLLQLYHNESDFDIEWKPFMESISNDVEVVYVYGFNPHVDPLIQWLDADCKRDLVFIETQVSVLKKIERDDCGQILNHPQIHLKVFFGDTSLEEFIEGVIREFPFEKIQVFFASNEVKKLLFRKATLEFAIHAEMLQYHFLAKNLIRNFRRLSLAFEPSLWKDKFKDVPAIVCGAGPSLKDVAEKLKGLEEKALLFAGGSAIPALTSLGIIPHLLFAIDPNPEEFTRLAFHSAYNTPLIFGCRLEPNVFYAHAGPIGYLPTGTGGPLEEWMEERLGIHDYKVLEGLGEEALSVTAITFMSAVYLGCNPIILAGVDLSYDDGKRYSDGVISDLQCQMEECPKKASESLWRDGDVDTITKWLMERDVLDEVAKNNQDKIFLKASAKGLSFENIFTSQDFDQNISGGINLREKIESLILSTSLKVDGNAVEANLEIFFQSIKKCQEIVTKFESADQITMQAILEMDLEEELAYQIALKQAVYALTFQVRREYRTSEFHLIKKAVFKRVQWIIDEYLKLC